MSQKVGQSINRRPLRHLHIFQNKNMNACKEKSTKAMSLDFSNENTVKNVLNGLHFLYNFAPMVSP